MWFSMVATSLRNLKCSNLIVDQQTICHENNNLSPSIIEWVVFACQTSAILIYSNSYTFSSIKIILALFSVAFAFYSFVVEIEKKKTKLIQKFYLWDHFLFYSVPNFELIVFAKKKSIFKSWRLAKKKMSINVNQYHCFSISVNMILFKLIKIVRKLIFLLFIKSQEWSIKTRILIDVQSDT